MPLLAITETKSTPKIVLDSEKALLEINGQSYPENAFTFYEPVLHSLKACLEQQPAKFDIVFSLRYINTSSSKCVMMILDTLETANNAGVQISLKWLYDPENEFEAECAQEFQEDYSFPFEIVALEAQ